MEKIFEIYIKTTPERLWEAITDSDIRSGSHEGPNKLEIVRHYWEKPVIVLCQCCLNRRPL